MDLPEPVIGTFPNGMAYARQGSGPKTALVIPGGPGNEAPGGSSLRMFRSLIEEDYSVWNVTRKRAMPKGYTMAGIAADYAELIAGEFGGRVDLVIGFSFGGMVAFYLAADHPERFGQIAIIVAGYETSERGKVMSREFARHLSEGRTGDAVAVMLDGVAPPWFPRVLVHPVGALVARFAFGRPHPDFASDVMIEAGAEVACDARETLPRIAVPVLLVGAARDVFYPREVMAETASLIPDCTLRVYEGRGHVRVASDRQVVQDVLDFVHRHRARAEVQPGPTA